MDMHDRNALRERFLRMGKKSNWFNRPSLADKIAELKKEVKPYGRTYHILNKSKTDFLFTNDRGRGLDGNDSACVIIDSDDGNDELDDENDNNSYANEDVKYACAEIDGKNHSPIISRPKHIECVVIDSDDADDDLDCGSVCVDSIGNSSDISQDRSTAIQMDISQNDNNITNTKIKEDVVNGHTDSDDGNDTDNELDDDDDQHTGSNDGNSDNDDKLDDDDQHTECNDGNSDNDDELAHENQHTDSKNDDNEVDDNNGQTNSIDEDDNSDLDGYNDTEGMKYTCTVINGENDSPITRPKRRHREKGRDGNGSARGVIDSDDADDDLDSMDSVGNLTGTNVDHPSEMQLDICENNNHVTDTKMKYDDGNGRTDSDHGSDDDHNELDDSKNTDSRDDDNDNNELVGDNDNEDVSYICTGINDGNDSPITSPKCREKGLDGNSPARGVIDSDDADDELNCGRVCVDSIGNLSDINQDRCTEIQLDISESNNCVTKTKEEVEVEDVDNGHTDSDNGSDDDSDELDDDNGHTDSNDDDDDDLDGDNDNEDVRYTCTGIDDRNNSPITRPKRREKGRDGNGSARDVIDSDDADGELECGRVCVDSIDIGNCSDVHQDRSTEIHLDISESNNQVTSTKEEVEEEDVDIGHTDSDNGSGDDNVELDDDNGRTDSNDDDNDYGDDIDGDNENEGVRYTCIGINGENDLVVTSPKHSNNNHSSSNAVEDASPGIISESPFKASMINYSSSYAIEDASPGTSGSPLKVSMNSSSNTVEDASPGISESPLKASLTARLLKKYNPEKSETDVEDFELFLQKVRTPKQSGLSGEKKKREASLNEFIVDDDEVDQEEEDVFYDDPGFIPELEELSDDDKENDCIEITTPASSIASFKTPRSTTSSTPFKTPKSRTLSSNSSCPKSVLDNILNPYSTEKDFKKSKDKLVRELFELYNRTVFDNQLPSDFQITWNPRMRSTAGFCYYSKKNNIRMARIELADKVIDSADRLRDTLIHEMCHAAAWMISGIKAGHGTVWKKWTLRANSVHQDLPPISRCHSYTINAKYTYRCTNNACANSFGRHSKSVNLEKSRCAYCHSRLELVPQLKKDGTPQSRTPNRFALFVKQNYARIKSDNDTFSHQDVMKALSTEFTKLSTS